MRRFPVLFLIILVLSEGVSAQFRRDETRVKASLLRENDQSSAPAYAGTFLTDDITADSIFRRVRWEPFDIATIGVQAGIGLGGAAIVGGLAVGIAAGSVRNRGANSLVAGLTILIVGSAATAVAIPTGVYYGGEWTGGNGSYGWTMMAGVGASLLTSLPVLVGGGIELRTLLPLFLASGLTGSILGYHLSASPVYATGASGSLDIPGREALDGITITIVSIQLSGD